MTKWRCTLYFLLLSVNAIELFTVESNISLIFWWTDTLACLNHVYVICSFTFRWPFSPGCTALILKTALLLNGLEPFINKFLFAYFFVLLAKKQKLVASFPFNFYSLAPWLNNPCIFCAAGMKCNWTIFVVALYARTTVLTFDLAYSAS